MAAKSILLLSAYETPALVYWREGLAAQFPEHRWQVLAMPPRHYNWHQRGSSLAWAFGKERELLYRHYDVIVACSTVDLSALRGFLPHLAEIPTIVYFHDNVFVSPHNDYQQAALESQLTSLYTALCADKAVFNSEFNRRSFLDGARKLLVQMPDFVPDRVVEQVEQRSLVLPVPLQDDCKLAPEQSRHFSIVWNHRWEYEKGPDRLLLAVEAVLARDIPAIFHVIGQIPGEEPEEFSRVRALLKKSQMLGNWGALSRKQYLKCLSHSHVALSTSMEDFQGLAIMEAAAVGCMPLVPDRLCYPEYYPVLCRYPSNLANPRAEAMGVASRIAQFYRLWSDQRLDRPRDIVLPWWSDQKAVYRKLIEDIR